MAQHPRVSRRAHGMAVGAVEPRTVARQHAQVDRRAQADHAYRRWQRSRVEFPQERAARPHLRAAAAPGQPGDPGAAVRGPREDGLVHHGIPALEQVLPHGQTAHRMSHDRDARYAGAAAHPVRGSRNLPRVIDVAAVAVAEREAVHRSRVPPGADEVVTTGPQHTRRVAPPGNEQDGRPVLHHQLIFPCCDVSISSVLPDLNRNASMFDMRNSRAGWSRTSRP